MKWKQTDIIIYIYIYIYKERDLAHHIMIHYCLLYERKIIKFGDDK